MAKLPKLYRRRAIKIQSGGNEESQNVQGTNEGKPWSQSNKVDDDGRAMAAKLELSDFSSRLAVWFVEYKNPSGNGMFKKLSRSEKF